MLKDLVPRFKEELDKHPKVVMDNYDLKEGIYFRFYLDRTFEENIKNKEYKIIRKKENDIIPNKELVSWFKIRDYYSSVLNDDMNKAVDVPAKKIHSTNGLTLFFKSDLVLAEKSSMSPEQLDQHIQSFFSESLSKTEDQFLKFYPLVAKKKAEKEKELAERDRFFKTYYHDLHTYLHSPERTQFYTMASVFWKEHFLDFIHFLQELSNEHPFTNYVKVFFSVDADEEKDEQIYKKEYQLYILPRIFNVNAFNVLDKEKILGLPAYDVSMNAKKPFYELKTMKTLVPTRTSLEEALLIKDLYKSIEKRGKMREHILSIEAPFEPYQTQFKSSGAYHVRMGGNGGIEFFENVPFRQKEECNIEMDNVLQLHKKVGEDWLLKLYDPIRSFQELYYEINRCFFAGKLGLSLLGDENIPKVQENVFTGVMQSIFIMTRQALYDFLYKGTTDSFKPFLQKYSLQLIEEQLCQTVKGLYVQIPAEAFLLRLGMMKYLKLEGGEEMAVRIEETYEIVKSKVHSKGQIVGCDSDMEFCFLAGQLGHYLLTKSEAHNKNYGMLRSLTRAKNTEQLKKRLKELFETYEHALGIYHTRFKNGFSMVMGYDTDFKIEGKYQEIFLAGLMAHNLFYDKSDQEKENKEDKKNGEDE